MESVNQWIGLGIKVGGILGIFGMESVDGYIRNLAYPSQYHSMNVTSVRFGAGLGGSAGYVAILLFNCSSPSSLNGEKVVDWSINVAMGEKWDGVVKGLKNVKFFKALATASSSGVGNLTPKTVTRLRNGMSYLYSAYDIASMSGSKLITLDIPGAGIGEELSINYMEGEMTVGDLVKPEE